MVETSKDALAFNRPFLCEANSAIDPSYWAPAQSEVTGNMSVVINSGGLRVNNGALSIYNNAGSRVLYGDTNGNLTMTGTVTATSGKIGGFDIGALRLSAQNNGKIYCNAKCRDVCFLCRKHSRIYDRCSILCDA